MQEKILLFIPMYNCEKQIIRVLNKINNENIEGIDEIVIVNNRSTDNGEQVVIDYMKTNQLKTTIKLLKNDNNYGLGGSHKVAFEYAISNNFDYIIVLHGDDQANIEDLTNILQTKEYREHDCVLGSRFSKESKLLGYSKFRIFGNIVYNCIFSILLCKKITDLGSGLNMYDVKMLENKFYQKYKDNLTFNCYMLLAAKVYKQDIYFFPISWREEDQVSNVKMVRQAMNTLKLVLKYFFYRRKYLEKEHRDTIYNQYTYQVTYEGGSK